MIKKLQLVIIIATLISTTFIDNTSNEYYASENNLNIEATSAISIDYQSGKIFYSKNSNKPYGIASISKILGLYVVEQQVKKGKLDWDDTVPISNYARNISQNQDLSNVPLYKNNKYTVKDLYEASVIESANGAIIALAEKVAGSEPNFVRLIRKNLKSWGISDVTIVNSTGLNNTYLGKNIYPNTSEFDENLMSAKDVAIVARKLIKDFPEFLKTSKIATKMFGKHTDAPFEMTNWNWMLPGLSNSTEGVDGLKTGTTDLAGACFVGTIKKGNRRVITVVLNAHNHPYNHSARFIETKKLMSYSLNKWSLKTVKKAKTNIPNQPKINVKNGKQLSAPIVIKDSVKLWMRYDMDPNKLTYNTDFENTLIENGTIDAPSLIGKKIGKVTINLKEDSLGYIGETSSNQTDVEINKTVEKANIVVRLWRGIKNIFTYPLSSISCGKHYF